MNLPSARFSLKTMDFLKGLIMAVATPVLYILQELIPGWNIDPIYKAGISAAIAYLIKNYFTDDNKAAVKTIDEAQEKQQENLRSV